MKFNKKRLHAGLGIIGCSLLLQLTGCASTPTASSSSSTGRAVSTALKPNVSQAIAAVNTYQLLKKINYRKNTLDADQLNAQYLNHYLYRLDPQHEFFTIQDIAEYADNRFITNLQNGDLRALFNIAKQHQQRAKQREDFISSRLTLDYIHQQRTEASGQTEIEAKTAGRALDQTGLQQRWQQRFNGSIQQLQATALTDQQLLTRLQHQQQNRLNTLKQKGREQYFNDMLNAYTVQFDPRSVYYSPLGKFELPTAEGVGAVISLQGDYPRIDRLIPGGSAAQDKSLNPGDRVIAVGEATSTVALTDTGGMDLDTFVKQLRGPAGSQVVLEVLDHSGKISRHTLTRQKVALQAQAVSATVSEINQGTQSLKIATLTIPSFYVDFQAQQAGKKDVISTERDVRRWMAEFSKQQIDGLLIDLRGNGGGSLQQVTDVCDLFVGSTPCYQFVERKRLQQPIAKGSSGRYSKPLVILVDGQTASGAELLAAGLQDYGQAVVVGSRTFGAGALQTMQALNHGQLKLSVAELYRVTGQPIEGTGLTPDIPFPALVPPQPIPYTLVSDLSHQIEAVTGFSDPDSLPADDLRQKHQQRTAEQPAFSSEKMTSLDRRSVSDSHLAEARSVLADLILHD
ncbi:S41 family peptidase [Endozoicomonadaceae bacterium StTr2]